MSFDGRAHQWIPIGALQHRPEEGYVGLHDTLEGAYAYSQETGRVLATKTFPYVRHRSAGFRQSHRRFLTDWTSLWSLFQLIPRPTDTLTATLGFRAWGYVPRPETIDLRLTVGASVGVGSAVTAEEQSGPDGDRDHYILHTVEATVELSAEDLSSGKTITVEGKKTGQGIYLEWLILWRTL